ncbi:MAG: hypothetical protein N2663_02660 [Chlorobi bacterium]|nr:hypothetical protein [Chlorobiota bacterium]
MSLCGFLGVARGANEVPASFQQWDITAGISALVREHRGGFLAGELNFWYARTRASTEPWSYATGAIVVDVRGRAMIDLPLSEPIAGFISLGVGVLFPLNERVLAQPPSPSFEPNTPTLALPIAIGARAWLDEQYGVELRATSVLTTTDNLNAPHDGQADGFFTLTLGVVVRLGY